MRCDCGQSSTSDWGRAVLPCCQAERARYMRDRATRADGEPKRLGHELFRAADGISGMLERFYGIVCLYDGDDCGYRVRSKGGWGVLAYPNCDNPADYSDVMAWSRFLDWLPHDAKALVLAHVALYDRYMHANRVL